MHLFLRAISFVAVIFRLLHVEELFAAVINEFDYAGTQVTLQDWKIIPANSNDFMQLCSSVLQTHEDGSVDFSRSLMRRFLLDSEVVDIRNCHETMTRTCFQHIQQTESRTLLRPWKNFWRTFSELTLNPFINYARKYWPKHYRIAESASNGLPARLHDMVELAIVADHPREEGYLSIEIRRMTLDVCLDLSLRYGFEVLEQLCRRAGANNNSQVSSTGLVSDCQNRLCRQHLQAACRKFEQNINDQKSWDVKQVRLSTAMDDRDESLYAKSTPSSAERIYPSEDRWVLIRYGRVDGLCNNTNNSGRSIDCLTAEFQEVGLQRTGQPSRHDRDTIYVSSHGAQHECSAEHPRQSIFPDHLVDTQQETANAVLVQQMHSMTDWHIVDRREL